LLSYTNKHLKLATEFSLPYENKRRHWLDAADKQFLMKQVIIVFWFLSFYKLVCSLIVVRSLKGHNFNLKIFVFNGICFSFRIDLILFYKNRLNEHELFRK